MKTFTNNSQTHDGNTPKPEQNENQSSRGAVFNNEQQRTRNLAAHDEQLSSALNDACESAGLADGIRQEIIEGGLHRFVISAAGEVKALSVFPDIATYVQQHQSAAPSPAQHSAATFADDRIMKKKGLYDKMVVLAKVGDMKGYRAARTAYAQL